MHEEGLGQIKISEDVIVKLCAVAVMNTEGVSALSGGITESLSKNILGKSSPTKGIKVLITEKEDVIIDLFIIVKYGVKIPEVAWNIQESVKKEIELATGYAVKGVNIHVQGVAFEEEE